MILIVRYQFFTLCYICLIGTFQPHLLEKKRSFCQIFRKDLLGIGLLGVGSFGAVELVGHRHAEETFAMKSSLASQFGVT